MYKNVNQLKEHQIARRTQLLEGQRKQRDNQFSLQRDLKKIIAPKTRRNEFNETFRYNLMLSEWMMSRPEDIDDFLMVPCPKGIRCSLSTEDGSYKAKLYYKNGRKFLEFKTNLPAYTILDCIYSAESRTVYILDVTAFANRDLIHGDAAFRFFWLSSKFTEEDIKTTDTNEGLHLRLLRSYDFSDTFSIRTCFQTYPIFTDGTDLDGYLFYHKEGSYTVGESPLVLWLFPFMIDELFDTYRVNPCYHSSKPDSYTNYIDFITEFESKQCQKKKHFSKKKAKIEYETMDLNEVNEQSFDDSQNVMQTMIELEMTGNDA